MSENFTMEELLDLPHREVARRLMICERVRKHWRILAIQAALGGIDIDGLQRVCFQEQLGHAPSTESLDKAMSEMLKLVDEQYADGEAEYFKELRRIELEKR